MALVSICVPKYPDFGAGSAERSWIAESWHSMRCPALPPSDGPHCGHWGASRAVADLPRSSTPGRLLQRRPSFSQLENVEAMVAPLRIDVRPTPLHPKRSAPLRLLEAANSSLFAGVPFLFAGIMMCRAQGVAVPTGGELHSLKRILSVRWRCTAPTARRLLKPVYWVGVGRGWAGGGCILRHSHDFIACAACACS